MSKGKIKGPVNGQLQALSFDRKPMKETFIDLLESSSVEVEDKEWQKGDEAILAKISELKEVVENIDARIGKSEGSIADRLKILNDQIMDIQKRKPLDMIVQVPGNPPVDMGIQHCQTKELLLAIANKVNIFLVGPAGGGKTHAASSCARALGLEFFFTGAIANEYKLTGFIDAHGKLVRTPFREAYEHGGLFLFDEIDASHPQAVLAFNAALSNDRMDFPDRTVKRHSDFYCIAAANTYGLGADRKYVGRNQLDAASLDRFVFIEWHYDENLERHLSGNDEWVNKVIRIRQIVDKNGIRHVISPRASINGSKLLASGFDQAKVEEMTVYKGMDRATKNKIADVLKGVDVLNHLQDEAKFTPSVKCGEEVKKGQILGYLEYTVTSRYNYQPTNYKDEIISEYNGVVDHVSHKGIRKLNDKLFQIFTVEKEVKND